MRWRQTEAIERHRQGDTILEGLQTKDWKTMKRKPSISHDEAVIRHLREDPEFAAEYLKAAIEDTEEPKVLLQALRRLAEARRLHQNCEGGRG